MWSATTRVSNRRSSVLRRAPPSRKRAPSSRVRACCTSACRSTSPQPCLTGSCPVSARRLPTPPAPLPSGHIGGPSDYQGTVVRAPQLPCADVPASVRPRQPECRNQRTLRAARHQPWTEIGSVAACPAPGLATNRQAGYVEPAPLINNGMDRCLPISCDRIRSRSATAHRLGQGSASCSGRAAQPLSTLRHQVRLPTTPVQREVWDRRRHVQRRQLDDRGANGMKEMLAPAGCHRNRRR